MAFVPGGTPRHGLPAVKPPQLLGARALQPLLAVTQGPLVSVVVLNFNYARFLPRVLDAVLAQTWPRLEVLVVDDASTDGSREVIARYGERVKPVLQRENRGQGGAINAGFAHSRGELVFFLDADDWLYPHAVERVVGAWTPEVSLVHFRLHLVDAQGRVIDTYPAPEIALDSGDVVPSLLTSGRYEALVTSGNAFSRAALAGILPMPEEDFRLCADGYLVTVAPFAGPVVSIDEPLGAYCQHGENRWAGGKADADLFRRLLAHDERRYRSLARRAQALGLEPDPRPGLRDHRHLANRLASLCLDPAGHPFFGESRLSLSLRGLWASRRARLPAARRLILGGWFAASGLLPRALARPWVCWFHDKRTRPPFVQRLITALRAPALAVARRS